MTVIVDKRSFTGGMNSDMDKHVLPQDSYPFALNIRNSPSGSMGVVTNVKGNEAVTYTLPAGGNKVIGAEEFVSGSKMYYLVWNSEDNHLIVEYDYERNEINTVFASSLLDFSSEVIVTGINVVRFKSNTIIYWTDSLGEPKKVSIDSGIRTFDPTKKVFQGTWVPGGYNEGDVVKVVFGANYFGRDFYYVAKVLTTQEPNSATIDPLPQSDWNIIEPGFVYPTPLLDAHITQLPKPPTLAPIVRYEDNKVLRVNKVRGSLWQFKYRYIYADGQQSAWSPISKTPVPQLQVTPLEKNAVIDVWRDNQISVDVEVDNNILIRSVKMAVRKVPDSLAPADFDEWEEVFMDDTSINWSEVNESSLTVKFIGTEDLISIDLVDSDQLFYYVPRRSKTQTLTGDNRLIHSNGTWGYDIDRNLITVDKPLLESFFNDFDDTASSNLTNTFPAPPASGSFTITIDQATILTKNKYLIKISWRQTKDIGGVLETFTDETTIVYEVTADDVKNFFGDIVGLQTKIAADISNLIEDAKVDYVAGVPANTYLLTSTSSGNVITVFFGNFPLTGPDSVFIVGTLFAGTLETAFTTPYRSFKRGSTQQYGLVYSDALGRVSTVVATNELSHYIEWYTARILPNSHKSNGLVSMTLELNHLAPEWATRCHIVKKRDNGVAEFVQIGTSKNNTGTVASLNDTKYFVVGIINNENDDFQDNTINSAKTLNIWINALNGGGSNAYNNMINKSVITYSFTEGDRLRVVSLRPQAGSLPGTFYGENDVEILSYNEVGNYITVNYEQLIPDLQSVFDNTKSEAASGSGILFEIYTPQYDLDERGFYFETGITLNVSNGLHTGTNGIEQVYGTSPALIDLDCGDVYYKRRNYVIALGSGDPLEDPEGDEYFLEEYQYDDTYESKAFNVGRFNVKTQVDVEEGSDDRSGQSQESLKPAIIFYSQPYVQGTDINRLGTIFDLNFVEGDASFNSIQYIHSDGDKLFIFHEDRVGMAYNARNVSTDLTGLNTVASTRSRPVISDIQYYAYRGGISLNPESFAFHESNRYWTDIRRGTVLRLAQNGIDEIQLKGVDQFIKGISKQMISGIEKDIAIGVYDKRNKEYTINFKFSESTVVEPLDIPAGIGDTAEGKIIFEDDVYMSQFTVGDAYTIRQNPFPSGLLGPNSIINFTVNRVEGNTLFMDIAIPVVFFPSYTMGVYKSTVISYSDLLGKWSSFYSFIPDFLESVGVDIVSWKDGALYLHESDTVNRGSFYGEDNDMEIEIVSNQDPTNVKTFQSISVKDNSTFELVSDAIVIDTETTVDGIETEKGQQSDLLKSDFEFIEGNLYASLLRDKLTPNVDIPLLDGDYLKGNWMSVRLKIDGGTTKAKEILSVVVKSVISFFGN